MADLTGSGRDDEQQPLPLPQPPAPAPVIQDPQNANWQAPNATPDQQTYEQTVADSIAQQYTPVRDDPPMPEAPTSGGPTGGYGVGGPIMPAATPPEPTGSDFFYGNPNTGLAVGGPQNVPTTSNPQVSYTSDANFFTPDNLSNLYQQGYASKVGPAPTPGDGSQWFGTPDQQQQQYGWWQSEMQRAIENGDQDKYNALMGEYNRVQGLWDQYSGVDTPRGFVPGALQHWQAQGQQQYYNFLNDMKLATSGNPQGEGIVDRWSGPTPQAGYDASGNLMLRTDVQNQYDQLMQGQADFGQGTYNIDQETGYLHAMQGLSPEQRASMFAPAPPTPRDFIGQPMRNEGLLAPPNVETDRAPAYAAGQFGGSDFYGPTPDTLQFIAPALKPLAIAGGVLAQGVGDTIKEIERPFSATHTLGAIKTAADFAFVKPGQIAYPAVKKQVAYDTAAIAEFISSVRAGDAGGAIASFGKLAGDTEALGAISRGDKNSQTAQEAQYLVDRFEQHTILDTAGSIAVDPWNFVPVHEIVGGVRLAGKAKLADVLLKDAIEPQDFARVKAIDPSVVDMLGWRSSQEKVERALVGSDSQALNLGNSKLADAFSKRLVVRGFIENAGKGDLQGLFYREVQDLPALAAKISKGMEPAEVTRIERGALQLQKRLANGPIPNEVVRAMDLTPRDVNDILATTRPRDVPPMVQAEVRSNQIGEAIDNLPAPAVEAVPDTAATAQHWTTFSEQFPLTNLQPVDFSRMAKETERAVRPIDFVTELSQVPAEQHYQRFQELLRTVSSSKLQAADAQALLDAKRLDRATAERIISGDMTRGQAQDALDAVREVNRRQLRVQGILPPEADMAVSPQAINAAAQEQATRDVLAQQLSDFAPRVGDTHPGAEKTPALRGFVRDQEGKAGARRLIGNNEVLTPGQYLDLLAKHPELLDTNYRGVVRDLLDLQRYVGKNGLISSTTVDAQFRYLVEELPSLTRHGIVPIQDAQLLHDVFHDAYFGSRIADAKGAQRLAELGENGTKHLDDLKARNLELIAQRDAAKAAGDGVAATRAQRQITENGAQIRQYEPSYRARGPRTPVAEKVAAQDETLRAAGLETPPTTDPLTVAFDAAPSDSSNDVIANAIAKGPADAQHSVIVDAPKQTTSMGAAIVPGDIGRMTPEAAQASNDAIRQAAAKVTPPDFDAQIRAAEDWIDQNQNRAKMLRNLARNGDSFDVRNMMNELTNKVGQRTQLKNAGTSPEALVEAFKREARGALDQAAGGGMGILHPAFAFNLRPLMDPHINAFHSLDWANPENAKRYEDYIDRMYAFEDGTGSTFRNRISPVAMTKSAQVTRIGDQAGLRFNGLVRDAYDNAGKIGQEPRAFVADYLRAIMNGSVEDIAKTDDYYTGTKHGFELLRTLRNPVTVEGKATTIGAEILRRWEAGAYNNATSVGWLHDIISVPGGEWRTKNLEQLDRYITKGQAPRNLDAEGRKRLTSFTDAVRDRWAENREALGFNPEYPGWEKGARATTDQLNRVLFPAEDHTPDLAAMIERMSSDVSEMEAARIGYDPSHIPAGMRTMQGIKANLSPLWMTIWPGYHLRNITGNVMGALMSATRSDVEHGIDAALLKDKQFMGVVGKPGSGIDWHPYVKSSLTGNAGVSDIASGSQRVIDAAEKDARRGVAEHIFYAKNGEGRLSYGMDKTPGLGWYKGKMEDLADVTEQWSKKNLYSQEFGGQYRRRWIQGLMDGGFEQPLIDKLSDRMGYAEVRTALQGESPEVIQQIISLQRRVIGESEMRAYEVTARALRDYRMRNRMDAALDKVFPVHYWTTKNALFVAGTLTDRPAIMLAGMKAYDTFQAENADLPPSLRMSLRIHRFGDDIPVIGGHTFYLRPTSFINPAMTIIPQLLTDKWDLSGTSLPDRIQTFAQSGFKNLYEAYGVNIGPQIDIALKLMQAAGTHSDKDSWWNTHVNPAAGFLSDPKGYGTDFLPLGPINESNIAVAARGIGKLAGRDFTAPQRAIEYTNQLVYGTKYTRLETANQFRAAAGMWQSGKISEAQYYVIAQALLDQKFDPDPDYTERMVTLFTNGNSNQVISRADTEQALGMVRGIVDGVSNASAATYLGSMLGASGYWLGDNALAQNKASNEYSRLKGVTDQQLNTMKGMILTDEQYNEIEKQHGGSIASAWMQANAPWLVGYWYASDQGQKAQQIMDYRAHNVSEQSYANYTRDRVLKDQAYADKQSSTAPFYDRISGINATYDADVQRAKGNMVLLDVFNKQRSTAISEVYHDAAVAGVDMVPSGALPRHGDAYYKGYGKGQKFFDALSRGDQQSVQEYETYQKQSGWVLDQVADMLDLNTHLPDGTVNPRFTDDKGFFDQQKYDAAVKDAAPQANALYHEVVANTLRQSKRADMSMKRGGVLTGDPSPMLGITATRQIDPADFEYHLRDKNAALNAFRDQRDADKTAWFAMPSGPEKDARADELRRTYGGSILDFTPKEKDSSTNEFTGRDNYVYNAGAKATDNYYYTLRPSQKKALRDEYPQAFTEVQGKDADTGDPYTSYKIDATKLTGDQIAAIRDKYGISIGLTGADRLGGGGSREVIPQQEFQRQQLNQQLSAANTAYYKQDYLTDEQKKAASDLKALKDGQGAQQVEYNGTVMSVDEAAFKARDEAKHTKDGFPSWYYAEQAVGPDSELGQYMAALSHLNTAYHDTGVKDAKQAWFDAQPPDVQQALVEEYPKTFASFVGEHPSTSTQITDASGTTTPSIPSINTKTGSTASGSTKSNSSTFVPYPKSTKSSSTYTPYTPVSGSTYFSNAGTSSSSPSGPYLARPSAVNQAVTLLDPMLVAGQDDGRAAIRDQIVDRFISLTAFQDKKMANMMLAGLLHWLMKKLGANPTLESWQSVLALLQSHQGQGGGGQQPQQRPMQDSAQPAIQPNMGGGEAFALAQRTNLPPTQSLGY